VVEQERALLEGAGFQVSIYSRDNDEIYSGSLGQRFRASVSVVSHSVTRNTLRRAIDVFHPDIVHIHNLFPLIGSAAYSVCRDSNIPVVQTLHNYRLVCASSNHFRSGKVCMDCAPSSLWSALRHRCYRNSLLGTALAIRSSRDTWRLAVREGGVARFVVLTAFAAEWLQRQGVAPSRIFIKPNFVDSAPLYADQVGDYAVYAGRLSEEKGLRTLLTAWRELPNVPLKLVGDGPLRPWIEKYIATNNLPIEMIGMRPRQEVRQLIAGATCLVFPSQWFEGMPMVLLEAVQSGTPIVASRIGGIAEILRDPTLHTLVEPGRSDELVSAIRKILRDPDVAHSRRSAEARLPPAYSSIKSIELLSALYRDVLSETNLK
jgi:glycosyltransferase involved in cell wall biosynthesis